VEGESGMCLRVDLRLPYLDVSVFVRSNWEVLIRHVGIDGGRGPQTQYLGWKKKWRNAS
jgi:hypothetical protein